CAAASAGPSGRGEDDGVDAGGAELLGDLRTHARAVGEGGRDTDRRIDRLVELADRAAPLQLARDVDGRQAMRVLLHPGRVVAAMRVVVLGRVEPRLALDAVGAVARRVQCLDTVGVAAGHQAPVGDEGDGGALERLDEARRGHMGEGRSRHLAGKRARRELERSGAIGKLHETVYSTVGVATTLAHSARMGAEIAEKLRAAGVDAVILTST